MATYIDVINKVLTRLREPQISSITDDYTRLIGQFVNEAKEEVEDAWNWTALRTTVSVSATVGDNTYNLTGTNNRTRILSAYNTTKKTDLLNVGEKAMQDRTEKYASQQGSPLEYSVYGVDSSTGELQVRLFPTPDASYTLTFYTIVPQSELSTTSTVVKVPYNPIVQLAYALAIKERGEDQGQLSPFQDQMYLLALGKAISQDEALHQDETTWQAT